MKLKLSQLRKIIREEIEDEINNRRKVMAPGFSGKDMQSFLSNWDEIRSEYEELGLEPPELEDWEEYSGEPRSSKRTS